MQIKFLILLSALLLAGCQSVEPLPYTAGDEGPARFIRADYVQTGRKIQVIVDSSAYKLENASITRSNGTVIKPLSIQRSNSSQSDMSQIGNIRGGYIGAGRSSGATLGMSTGGNAVQLKNYVWFDLLTLGDPPWTLNLKILGIGDLAIELPAKAGDVEPAVQTPIPSSAK